MLPPPPTVADRKLFTPGPLNTTSTVKKAMLVDAGSRDQAFTATVQYVRDGLLDLVHCKDTKEHTVVLLQGAGTFAVQAILDNYVGKSDTKVCHGHLTTEVYHILQVLVLSNGSYGERMAIMCEMAAYRHVHKKYDIARPLDMTLIEEYLKAEGTQFGLVVAVHGETSTGNDNDVNRLAKLVRKYTKARLFLDCMSTLGAIDVNMADNAIDFIASSANKCIQGVPGFTYIIARKDALKECEGRCRSWAMDLVAQDKGFSTNGQFRCTPATHTILAFAQALYELGQETRAGREKRYRANNQVIRRRMSKMGFVNYDAHLATEERGFIITPFIYPKDDKFDFQTFYDALNERKMVIYPGKVAGTGCFRLGNIGELHPVDCEALMDCCEEVLTTVMKIKLPVT